MPRNGDRSVTIDSVTVTIDSVTVTIDSVTSLHLMYSAVLYVVAVSTRSTSTFLSGETALWTPGELFYTFIAGDRD